MKKVTARSQGMGLHHLSPHQEGSSAAEGSTSR